MGSGPRAGLAEIFLPELQKGSSIMPGKVNPVIPEVVTQVAAQVIGNDAAITVGGMQGHFELNVFIPLLARNLLQSITLLASASRLLAEKCIDGIEANRAQCEAYAELTLSAATALNPFIGYDKASEIVNVAAASGRSLREVAREAGRGGEHPRRSARLPHDGKAAQLANPGRQGARHSGTPLRGTVRPRRVCTTTFGRVQAGAVMPLKRAMKRPSRPATVARQILPPGWVTPTRIRSPGANRSPVTTSGDRPTMNAKGPFSVTACFGGSGSWGATGVAALATEPESEHPRAVAAISVAERCTTSW